jgi:hypothetical protein
LFDEPPPATAEKKLRENADEARSAQQVDTLLESCFMLTEIGD